MRILILHNIAHQYYDSGIDALLFDRNKVFIIWSFLVMAMIKQGLSLLIWLNENVQSLLSLLPKFIYLLTVLVLVRVEPFDVVGSL